MNTILDFRSFEPRFKSGLLFSIFEGLKNGMSFDLICDQDPQQIKEQFQQAQIKNIKWNIQKIDVETWRVGIIKTNPHESGGCCGMCGEGN